jgi:hypothetical protein
MGIDDTVILFIDNLQNYFIQDCIVLPDDEKSLRMLSNLSIQEHSNVIEWKGSNRKQSDRWQHVSRLKASALCIY